MKTTTIEKRKQELEKQLEMLSIISETLDDIQNRCQWNTMTVAVDPETGDTVIGEDGNTVYQAPDEDHWRYNKYQAYQEVIRHMEKLINCK